MYPFIFSNDFIRIYLCDCRNVSTGVLKMIPPSHLLMSGDGKYDLLDQEVLLEMDEYCDAAEWFSARIANWKPTWHTAFVGRVAKEAGAGGWIFRRIRDGCCQESECMPESPCWDCNERMCLG